VLTLVCVYVDDNRVVSTDLDVRDKFVAAFGKRYPKQLDCRRSTGSQRRERLLWGALREKRDAKIEVSCSRLMAKLQAMIEELPSGEHLPEGTTFDSPMDKNALKVMRDSQSSHMPLGDIRVLKAQRIGDLGGYVVLCCCRPDGYLATGYLGTGK
jgi:hypothetical protein